MKKKYLNKKWLAEDLTVEEQEAFDQIEGNELFKKIVEKAPAFSVSNFSQVKQFETIKDKLHPQNQYTKTRNWLTPMLRIAAVFVIAFGVYFLFFFNNSVNIETSIAEKRMIQLPDASEVTLNAVSEITYNEKTWADKRELTLDGEAFFVVAKGSTFDVNTSVGKVSVVGTQFNVLNRENFFEVNCFEGEVTLAFGKNSYKVLPGHVYRISNGKVSSEMVKNKRKPLWMTNTSYFKKVPFYQVIKEFERHYKIEVSIDLNDKNLVFTGGFTHGNLQEALEAITKPLNLTYSMVTPQKISLHHIDSE
ncbi:MAG: FecR family protein [Flavobacteriaceae bacterium]|nr:FecR family protein [Flavobacteriaceae bacterium]